MQQPTIEQLQHQLAATQNELSIYKLIAKLSEKVERLEETNHSIKQHAEKQIHDLTVRNQSLEVEIENTKSTRDVVSVDSIA